MNRLQSPAAPVDFCVTLNAPDQIASDNVLRRIAYHHPVYSTAAFQAQKRRQEINGVKNALAVCRHFGKGL